MTHWRSTGADRWEVWVCDVPTDTTAEIYEPVTSRVALEPGTLVGRLAGVTTYFATISHGVYRPTFVIGGRVQLRTVDGPQECVDAALARSGPAASGVLAVASALQPFLRSRLEVRARSAIHASARKARRRPVFPRSIR